MKKKILVTPLSWGIGHATRCMPIIHKLIELNCEPILASDGDALTLFRKEFPNLKTYNLPEYRIKYSKNPFYFTAYLLFQVPRLLFIVRKEHQEIQKIIKDEGITGIINDNRFGCFSNKVKTVYITHQVNVLSGLSTFFTSIIHQHIIQKADALWIPDSKKYRLSGRLSKSNKTNTFYTGILSRFKPPTKNIEKEYDILVLLSGIENQRLPLEKKLIKELVSLNKKILFVRGILSDKEKKENTKFITFKNFLLKNELREAILKSELIISRSGYSTIMDLAVLQKKCFFIPTPNQKEQEYLAKRMQELRFAPCCKQKNFKAKMLENVKNYNGFDHFKTTNNLTELILNQF